MKRTLALAVLALVSAVFSVRADEIAVQVVLDTSGSMSGHVQGEHGRIAKIEAGKNALNDIVLMLQKHLKAAPGTTIRFGVIGFSSGREKVILPLGPFDPKTAVASYRGVGAGGGTPLGEAVQAAYKTMPKDAGIKRHIFVITDGEENGGVKTPDVMKSTIKGEARVYVVGFDIKGDVFTPIRQEGAMILEAFQEEELRTTVQSVFTKYILLERPDNE